MKYELEVVNIRLVREPSWYSEVPLRKTKDAAELMAREFADYDREVFFILNLASDGKIINMNIVSMGTLNASLVSPREVFKSSILSNAASIIAVHNHPSGCVNPSKQDKLITQWLREAGGLMDIELLDHIIVGGKNRQYYSFREENILNNNFSQQFAQERYDLDR